MQYRISESSFKQNIGNVLGHKIDIITNQLFRVMANDCPFYKEDPTVGITYAEFASFMTKTVFSSNQRDQDQLVFNLLDIDGDGEISIKDI
jgi:Ca2+-binding EF-hand superfamily protein